MDRAMTQADEIKRLKRQLEKASAERDGALKKLGQADAKLNDNAKQIIDIMRNLRNR